MEASVPTVALDPEVRLGALQRQARALGIPVIIVFEGVSAAGKGTQIGNLMQGLDPRGFNVHTIKPPDEEAAYRPFLWRFWRLTPERGRIAIFDRSWYRRVIDGRLDGGVSKKEQKRTISDIATFEQQLAQDGTLILKFFLYVSKKEQKARFLKLLERKATAWRVTDRDWHYHRRHREYLRIAWQMMKKTATDYAPWIEVDATDERRARAEIFDAVIDALERRVQDGGRRVSLTLADASASPDGEVPVLESVDLSRSIERESYEKQLKRLQKRLRDLQHRAYLERLPVAIVYEGWDAAGKGGNIRRLTSALDPRGYEVIPVAAPSDLEQRHHYLWRFWTKAPKAGHFAIFDRSWYGRVLVERVEGFCSPEQWMRAYDEINVFEKQWAESGLVLVKFWLHIDPDEQLRRFEERHKTVHKQWKITDEDWRNREKWGLYQEAVHEMIRRTSTPWAPWTLVEANDKRYARIKALKAVIDAVDPRL